MVSIAIVEDEQEAARLLQDCLLQYEKDNACSFSIKQFSSAEKFLAAFDCNYDIVFMDVDMPGMNGIDAARKLRERDTRAVLIFVTNLAQYAISGYEVSALDYILKPVNYYSLKLKIQRALDAVSYRRAVMVSIANESGAHYIKASEIAYIEVQNHDLIYHTAKGTYKATGTLKRMEEELAGQGFFRCNYCYLVNLAYVTCLEGNELTVGQDILQISRNRRKEFLQQLTQFYGRGGR